MAPGAPDLREHGHGPGPTALAFLEIEGEQHVVTAGKDGIIRVWNDAGEKVRETEDGEQDAFHSLAVSPDGSFLAAGDDTKVVVRSQHFDGSKDALPSGVQKMRSGAAWQALMQKRQRWTCLLYTSPSPRD